jgi:hypothetical protein
MATGTACAWFDDGTPLAPLNDRSPPKAGIRWVHSSTPAPASGAGTIPKTIISLTADGA